MPLASSSVSSAYVRGRWLAGMNDRIDGLFEPHLYEFSDRSMPRARAIFPRVSAQLALTVMARFFMYILTSPRRWSV